MLVSKARIFNETPINPRRCLHILTKIIYLLNQVHYYMLLSQHFSTTVSLFFFFLFFCSLRTDPSLTSFIIQGEHFGTTEATEAFFAMTRLFQSNDVRNSTAILTVFFFFDKTYI